jgi:acetate kinase
MTPTRSVLVVNMGSSSLKWVVLDATSETIQQQGDAHWLGSEGDRHQAELEEALSGVRVVDAVGHRVVHGGARFTDAVVIDSDVRQEIDRLSELAPLHNPAALAGIDAATARFPDVPQVATFDTAFHATIPDRARTYPLPWDWTTRWSLRRFGFHGLSVQYAIQRAAELLGSTPRRAVVCHLGAGCSVTAVADGRSIDTSMGFTPLEGLMMAQRSGSIDPGLLLYLQTRHRMDAVALDRALNQQSGLLGVSGVSADLRQVQAAADAGNDRARLAIDMFVHHVVSAIGGMLAALRGLDVLVFTGGIGEHSASVRAAVCDAFDFLGLRLDTSANEHGSPDTNIGSAESAVPVLVITAREDLSILRMTGRQLGWN